MFRFPLLSYSYAGSMRWAARNGKEYLLRKTGRAETSLGSRNEQTEATYDAFVNGICCSWKPCALRHLGYVAGQSRIHGWGCGL